MEVLPLERDKALKTIDNLLKSDWVDRATRCVFFEYTLYNANLNLFLIGKYSLTRGKILLAIL